RAGARDAHARVEDPRAIDWRQFRRHARVAWKPGKDLRARRRYPACDRVSTAYRGGAGEAAVAKRGCGIGAAKAGLRFVDIGPNGSHHLAPSGSGASVA